MLDNIALMPDGVTLIWDRTALMLDPIALIFNGTVLILVRRAPLDGIALMKAVGVFYLGLCCLALNWIPGW